MTRPTGFVSGDAKPVCAVWIPLGYAYEKGNDAASDTRETILKNRGNDARRASYCG
jgi:hypothetical protein